MKKIITALIILTLGTIKADISEPTSRVLIVPEHSNDNKCLESFVRLAGIITQLEELKKGKPQIVYKGNPCLMIEEGEDIERFSSLSNALETVYGEIRNNPSCNLNQELSFNVRFRL